MNNNNRPSARLLFGSLALALVVLLSACSDMLTFNPNREPVVNITPSQFTGIYPGNPVTFDATGTFDPDDQNLEVRWEVISSPTGATFFLDEERTFEPTFTTFFRNAPGAEASDRWVVGPENYSVPPYLGNYTLRMTVTDEFGVSRSGEVTVNVSNAAPGADAGGDSIGAVAPDADLSLIGTGGANEESSARNTWQYRWSVTDQPRDSAFDLTNTDWTDPSDPDAENTAVATFTPLTTGSDASPGVGVYRLRLEVRDEYGATSSNSITVATDGNTAPGLSMPDVANVDVTNGGSLDGTGAPGSPFSNSDHATTGDNYAFEIEYTSTEITNLEDDTMTVRWVVESIRGAFDEIRLGIDSGNDRFYGIGDTLITQTNVVDQFDLRINPAQDLASNPAFRTNDIGTNASSAEPDGTWDVAIRIIADDGHLTALVANRPVIYLDIYTPE